MLLTGCGSGEGTETSEAPPRPPRVLRLALDGYSGTATAGILMAGKLGYFRDAGLDVEVSVPLNPVRPVRYVVTDEVQLAVSHEPQVVLAREKRLPVVAIRDLTARSTAAIIWLKGSGIENVADLEGKTIAFPGLSFQRAFLQVILARAGLNLGDVKLKRSDYRSISYLVSGRADAIFGSSNVEKPELEARGLKPVVSRISSQGIPSYEDLVLISRPDLLAEKSQTIRDFMTALDRGTEAVLGGDRRLLIETILEGSEKRSRKAVAAEVEATLPLLSKKGHMDPEQAEKLVGWMRDEKLIRREPSSSELLTNSYLPAGSEP